MRSAVKNAATFDRTDAVLALSREVVFVSAAESRVQKSRRLNVGREIYDMKWHKDHLVVFTDGSVERLGVYETEKEEEAEAVSSESGSNPTATLLAGEKLRETWISSFKGKTFHFAYLNNFVCFAELI